MEQKIRIKLQAFDPRLLDKSARRVAMTARMTGARVSGPIPLPTRRTLITVIRSPHIDKRSREQFELKIHKRLIEIKSPTPDTIDKLSRVEIPAGVDVVIKVV
jgi:small subunit ribosomal protein S10